MGEQHLLCMINPSTTIVHKVDKFPWPFSQRDFVFLNATGYDADGTFYMTTRSLPHGTPGSAGYIPEVPNSPQHGKRVRANLELAGFRARPIHGSDPPRISVMQLVDASPGGSIPLVLMEKAMEERA